SVILRAVIGSRAYALATDDSDTDIRGVYVPSASLHWSLAGIPEQLEDDATQTTIWEIAKFLRLALKANPMMLEVLYSPIVQFASALGRELIGLRTAFLSKAAYRSFLGYANAQLEGMQKRAAEDRVKWSHAMHMCRLLIVGEELVRTGRLNLDSAPHRD